MRAAIYKHKGSATDVLSIATLPKPELGAGEARVKLAFSGVNPSDVKSRAGLSGSTMDFEYVVPHSDGAGAVDALGDGVTSLEIGQPVWVFNGQWARAHGTCAEYITLPAAQVIALPDAVPPEVGASIGIPLMTAYHAITQCGSLLGRVVLVFGAAGSVGFYATQLAKLGCATTIAVVSGEEKAAVAKAAGADAVVNYRLENVAARVGEFTAGRGVDFIIEVDAAVNSRLYGDILARGGKVIVYGSGAADISIPFRSMITKFATLYFFVVYRLAADELKQITTGIGGLLERSLLRHPSVAIYELGDIVAAHERVERGANAKVLVRL